jgi:hypothetical protein
MGGTGARTSDPSLSSRESGHSGSLGVTGTPRTGETATRRVTVRDQERPLLVATRCHRQAGLGSCLLDPVRQRVEVVRPEDRQAGRLSALQVRQLVDA